MRKCILLLCLVISTSSFGADRSAKIRALMEAQGLVQMFEQQIELGKQQGNAQAQQMLDQMMASLKPLPEFQARFKNTFGEFAKSLAFPWTAQEIVDVWASAYGKSFSDEELDQLVTFYTSPLGKKDVAATQKAVPEISEAFAERAKPIIEQATKKYLQDLQQIAKECNCRK